MYCPYCGSFIWTEQSGEAHCPGGGRFSVRLMQRLSEYVNSEPDGMLGEEMSPLNRWRCPGCGCRMQSRGARTLCPECRRELTRFIHEIVEFNPHPEVGNEHRSDAELVPYWITTHRPHDPLGFGVTGRSLADALEIIEHFGYVLPERRDSLSVIVNVRHCDLDPFHVTPNAGPIVVRGLWYPFVNLGM